MYILLLGPSGCGKGTQAKLLSDKINLPIVTMSDVLREFVKNDSELAREIKEYMTKGLFIDEKIASELLLNHLNENKIFSAILDGTHRNIGQVIRIEYAMLLSGLKIDQVIMFNLSKIECVKRIKARANGMMKIGLSGRADDLSDTAIESRINEFNKELELIKLYYQMHSNITELDASYSIEKIHDNLMEVLNEQIS